MKLEEIRLLKVVFDLNTQYKEKEGDGTYSVKPRISLSHKFIPETNELYIGVGLSQMAGNIPFFFDVKGGGRFKFDKAPEPKLLETYSTINCPAMVFPYIRETIADLTRRAGFIPLHVNPINFVELAKQKKETAEPQTTAEK